MNYTYSVHVRIAISIERTLPTKLYAVNRFQTCPLICFFFFVFDFSSLLQYGALTVQYVLHVFSEFSSGRK